MEQFKITPTIYMYDSFQEFFSSKKISPEDLIISNKLILDKYFASCDAILVDLYEFGSGEPSDKLVDAISRSLSGRSYDRVIGIGGGTILDVAKLFALQNSYPITPLFQGTAPVRKNKESIMVSTTCGTGSEVTGISILELTSINTKKGLATRELYANEVAIIPELIETLPDYVFATSSLDALVHAIESFLSPKATFFSKSYSIQAIELIIKGYLAIQQKPETRKAYLKDFLIASTCAGIAFDNAGCATVHALSYPLGAKYHVAHGESNYSLLMSVLNYYDDKSNKPALQELKVRLGNLLGCSSDVSLSSLGNLLEKILPLKSLSEYIANEVELFEFVESVQTNQIRLLANSHIPMSFESLLTIYKNAY